VSTVQTCRHPARLVDFQELIDRLEAARAEGHVYRRDDAATGRSLYCYTSRCVYETAWDEVTVLARGLVVDRAARRLVATPFPKFFNVGEGGRTIPDLPFEAFEKLDGSLAILHHHGGCWRAVTKGDFRSDQAKWAEAWLGAHDLSALVPGTTYLAEAVHPGNRIVVRYEQAALVLLAAYDEAGIELGYDQVMATAGALGWPAARRHAYAAFADMLLETRALPRTAEGFVIRFENGLRLKAKGDEYRRIHALISRCTPLAMWEAMLAGDDMIAIRRDLPEEFWEDFDSITSLLDAHYAALAERVTAAAASVAHLSDKELGLQLPSLAPETAPYLFAFRKAGNKMDSRCRERALKQIRPAENNLQGYTPSYAMGRLQEESL
jgi:RNA ligase